MENNNEKNEIAVKTEEKSTLSGSLKMAWKKFSTGVANTYDKTVEMGKDKIEATSINKSIKQTQEEIDSLYMKMGEKIYRMVEQTVDRSAFSEELQKIEDDYQKISELILQREMLKNDSEKTSE